jgi:acetyl-CoA carboxylase carboxyl transferase subunit beta
MEWFRKTKQALSNAAKRPIPDGLWLKCDGCSEIIYRTILEKNIWVCPKCEHHFMINSRQYLSVIVDKDSFEEIDADLTPVDSLGFKDTKKYNDRIHDLRRKTGLRDSVITGIGSIDSFKVSIAISDFRFLAGSMGSVMGEKVSRALRKALDMNVPFISVTSSGGGARMQEGILSLMQMAKTSAEVARLNQQKIPFISVLTHPTMAGVMASFASLGDIILAEPKALLGFTGPRVIQQTIGKELPPGFQRSEFLLEHGMVDYIVNRKDLRQTLVQILRFLRG